MRHFIARRRLLLTAAPIVLVTLAAGLGLALAGPSGVPGPISGLASTTHPDEATWYSSADPSFEWDPVLANGAAITGYSYVLDQSPTTVPDLSSERLSLDFLPRVAYATGARPTEVRVGDLNGDGDEDFVTANATGDSISVLIGRGDGTFNAKVDYTMGDQPWSLQLGDLDHDGDLDIVTGDLNANRASVRLNNGNGTFAARVAYTTGSQPECLRIGDVNNDTHLDIVTSNAGANTVSVLRGRGDGTFRNKADFATSVHPTSLDIGDLNGDGNQDLIAANTGPSTVSVLLGNGDGTFDPKVDYATGSTPYTVIVAEVNGDAGLDVATVNNAADSASVLIGNGDGTLKTKVDYTVGDSPYALDVRDLNQDGAADLVTTNNGANTASVLMGNGDGTFAAKTDYATGSGPFWVTLGDFNHDGYGDLVSTDYANGANTASVRLGAAYLAVGFTGKADGVWHFHVRALDSYGDGGETSHRTVRIDTTAPTTTQSGADEAWHDGDVAISFVAADAASGVAGTEYRVDGGAWTAGNAVTVLAPSDGTNDGEHTVEYRSTDIAGNAEMMKSQPVRIVTSAPTTSVSGADELWHESDVTLAFSSGSYGVAKTEYRIDGGEWVEGTEATIAALADGSNDGEHTVEYRSTNGAGHVEEAKSVVVRIDAGAPTTSVSGGDDLWHNSDVTLDFSGSDAGSGVARVEYRIDGGEWVEGTSVTVPASPDGSNDGEHTIEYRSTDASGHVEDAKSLVVRIDVGAPTTSVSGADDLWHDSDVTLDLSGSDAGGGVAKVQYRIDGGVWTDGTPAVIPAVADGSNDGEHTVEYRSTDVAGNVEDAKSVVVKIVTVAPTTDVSGADDLWHNGDVTVSFASSSAGVAATEYRIDGGEWVEGTEATIAALADGSSDGEHTVEYRSTTALGHVENAKSVVVRIDAGAPTSSVSGADDLWHDSDVTLGFSGADGPGSGVAKVEYRIDGGEWVEGTEATIAALADGSNDGEHTVEYRSTDVAGNVEEAKSTVVRIDAGAPTTGVSGADDLWHDSDVTLGFSGADGPGSGVAKVEYRIDGGEWIEGTEATIAALADGSNDGEHTVEYRSTDASGHVEDPQSAVVRIDAGAPTTSVSGADDLWHDSDVTLDFSASDAGSGVAKVEYRIDGGDWVEGTSLVVPAPADGSFDGIHTVDYRATDALGHVEDPQSLTVKIGRLDTRGRYVLHKLSKLRVSWPATVGAASYDVMVEGEVVASTTDLTCLYNVPSELKGVDLTVEVIARDAGGVQLWISGREQPWRK